MGLDRDEEKNCRWMWTKESPPFENFFSRMFLTFFNQISIGTKINKFFIKILVNIQKTARGDVQLEKLTWEKRCVIFRIKNTNKSCTFFLYRFAVRRNITQFVTEKSSSVVDCSVANWWRNVRLVVAEVGGCREFHKQKSHSYR